MIRVLLQLRHPCLRDVYRLLLRVIFTNRVSRLVCTRNDILHVLVSQSAHQTEEEISFRQSPRQLLLTGQIFHQQFILHSVLIQVLHRDLLLAGYIHAIYFVVSKEHLGLT